MSLNPLMLEMLNNSNKQPLEQSLLDMMEGQDALSPKAKMLIQMMSAGNNETEAETDAEYQDVGKNRERKLRRKAYLLQDELREAQEMVDVMADAIGACSICFGGDDQCSECEGEGIPGWQQPDQKLFSHFIVPAIKRIKSDSLERSPTGRQKNRDEQFNVTQRATPLETKGEYDV